MPGQSAMAADGKMVAAWLQRDEDKVARAYLAEYDNNTCYLPGTLLNIENQPAFGMALAAASNGNIIVGWPQSDGKNMFLYSRVFRVLRESSPVKPKSLKKGEEFV